MMIVLKGFNSEIKFSDSRIQTLVIENKQLFRSIIRSFDNETPEEYFVFSRNYEPFDFYKKGVYVSNAVNLELNNKKVLTRVNLHLEQLANDDCYTKIINFKSALMEFADELVLKSDFDLEYNYEIDTKAVIKLLDFKFTNTEGDYAESFIRYAMLLSEYLGISVIAVSGLHLYFEKEELDLIFETLCLNEINIICIEGLMFDNKSDFEKTHIIDAELCEIE